MERTYEEIRGVMRALHRGDVVDLDGLSLVKDEGEIRPGDLYVAGRNTGPHLLTARVVDEELGCIHSRDPAYSYDTHQCVKVREATN